MTMTEFVYLLYFSPGAFFCHQLIRQTSRHYGKNNENSRNWRYAGLLWLGLAARQSEIFLNFAPQPTLHLVISSCPPTQTPLVSSVLCNWSPPYCFSLTHATQGKKKKKRLREMKRGKRRCAATPVLPVSLPAGWRNLNLDLIVAWCASLECEHQVEH